MGKPVAYREGIVTKETLCDLNCCHIKEEEDVVFRYIELIGQDGGRQFVYEDEEGYQSFKENFEKNRMSSFHEFFTTEKKAYEERGEISLPYYESREDAAYAKMSLEEKRKELEDVKKLADRLTSWGKYDRRVNYHYADGEQEFLDGQSAD